MKRLPSALASVPKKLLRCRDALNIKERATSGEQIPQYEIYGPTSRLNTIRKSLAEAGGAMS